MKNLLPLLLLGALPALAQPATRLAARPQFRLATRPVSRPAPTGPTNYAATQTWPIGGEGGWDYVWADAAGGRLYASHGTQVEVLDLASGKLVGTLANTPRVHGILTVPGLNRGFVSCGGNNTVLLFDPKTLRATGSAPTGQKPDALLYDEFTKHVFVFNNGTTTATVLDAATGAVVGTAELGGAPEAGVSDHQGTIFVNLEDKNEIVAFDAKTLVVKHRWPLAPGQEPTGLAIDVRHRRLFSGCDGKLIILDADNGKVLAALPTADGVDGVVFDPARQDAFASGGSGSLTVVHEDGPNSFRVAQTVPTARGARTCALDETTHRVFLLAADYGPAPAPTAAVPKPRPAVLPGTFRVVVVR